MNTTPVASRHQRLALLSTCLLALGLAAGCATPTGPFPVLDTTKFTLENTDNFVALDKAVQQAVTCTGISENRQNDRLEVVANVKNRESRRVEVQISCVFKDEQGFSTGDETPFQTLILTENATEAVRFTAMNANAKRYTVRVRQAR